MLCERRIYIAGVFGLGSKYLVRRLLFRNRFYGLWIVGADLGSKAKQDQSCVNYGILIVEFIGHSSKYA
jgi:hypothetical protein